jgi:hypothetical protein
MTRAKRQGKKVDAQPLRPRRSRRSRSSARSSHKRGLGGRARPDSILEQETWRISEHSHKNVGFPGEGIETLACRKAVPASTNQRRTALGSRLTAFPTAREVAVVRSKCCEGSLLFGHARRPDARSIRPSRDDEASVHPSPVVDANG